MLDIQLIREQPDLVKAALNRRGIAPPIDRIVELDAARRSLLTEVEALKAERNRTSKEIGRMENDVERAQKIAAMRELGDRIDSLDLQVSETETALHTEMIQLPNLPDSSVPDGPDESANVIVKTSGEPQVFDFEALPHWELGTQLGIIDFEAGVKVTGSRFYVLRGEGARLQRALISWMLDLHIQQGYLEMYTPFIVREETVFASGKLPKFGDELFKDDDAGMWMIPTAEVPLTAVHLDEILDGESLPFRYTAYSPCFRREKISAGSEVRGIKRGYQFDKVEMYTFCKPEDSEEELERILGHAEAICRLLGLTYRQLELCTGDLGFTAHKTYDLEVWVPGTKEWLEVSSISNCGDFQARRANTRYREREGESTKFVHTLNGSGLALPRTMIAILENYQQEDGSVLVPEVLQPWMGGVEVIRSDAIRSDAIRSDVIRSDVD